ncbi:hypothetical protein J8I87_33900 [Paraburkholderia sp. LEh10]|uniref:hypothetical protein n=1 Tax=Paraburkholderia sp. LEh10 TaxID=2821353 RepID=UPI001AE1C826|nr:hypothetical protein [Paraburkholderia sp. LEh10]MBP0594569.1 hypothetical protein [Paraburkholderia sp. LEh10]
MKPFKLKLGFAAILISGLVGMTPAIGQVIDPQTGTVYNNVAGGMINTQTGEFYPGGGAINTQNGQYYPPTGGGVLDTQTGQVYPQAGAGYINPQTGQYMPSE